MDCLTLHFCFSTKAGAIIFVMWICWLTDYEQFLQVSAAGNDSYHDFCEVNEIRVEVCLEMKWRSSEKEHSNLEPMIHLLISCLIMP